MSGSDGFGPSVELVRQVVLLRAAFGQPSRGNTPLVPQANDESTLQSVVRRSFDDVSNNTRREYPVAICWRMRQYFPDLQLSNFESVRFRQKDASLV